MGWRLAALGKCEEGLPSLSFREILRRVAPLIRPYAKYVYAAAAATVLRLLLNLAIPVLMGLLIDSAMGGSFGELTSLSLVFLGCAAAYWWVGYARAYFMIVAGQSLVRDLRAALLDKLLRVRIEVLSKEEVGRLVSRVMSDVDVIGDAFTGGLIDAVADAITMVGALAVMVTISSRLTLVVLPLLPAVLLINYHLAAKARKTFRMARKAVAKVTAKVEQEVSGAAVVKTYVRRRDINEREFEEVSRESVSLNVEAAKVVSSVDPLMSVMRALGIAAILYVGGVLVLGGEMTVGTIVAFYGYLSMFFRPLQTLAMFFNSIQSALAAAERVTELLKAEEEEGGALRSPVKGYVELRNVHFGYERNLPVIKGVSLEVKPGELVAIVGPTGSGKSTLAKLLLRFYDPWSGEILLDGRRVDEYDLSYLRRVIAYVPQEPAVISGKVYDNLVAGRPSVRREEVRLLLRRLSVDRLLESLPQGLETEVFEEGKNLSKGQRQVISLVRALVSNPRVLVLDEATSNVDILTELEIYRGLKRLAKERNMAVLVIAHRLAAVTDAHRIYVIDGGKVVEKGAHEELLRRGGLYAKLWRAQSQGVRVLASA